MARRGHQGRPGARFRGSNRNGIRRWRTVCEAADPEPGRRFSYDVSTEFRLPISRWRYDVAPHPDGTCTVTESNWARVPLWFVPVALLVTGVINRSARNAESIATTLNRLRSHFESHRPESPR